MSRETRGAKETPDISIKGNKMKTVLRKGCLRKKLVNRVICAENA